MFNAEIKHSSYYSTVLITLYFPSSLQLYLSLSFCCHTVTNLHLQMEGENEALYLFSFELKPSGCQCPRSPSPQRTHAFISSSTLPLVFTKNNTLQWEALIDKPPFTSPCLALDKLVQVGFTILWRTQFTSHASSEIHGALVYSGVQKSETTSKLDLNLGSFRKLHEIFKILHYFRVSDQISMSVTLIIWLFVQMAKCSCWIIY